MRCHGPVLSVVVSLAISCIGLTASAQTTYYWDNNGSTAGFGTASGTWAATTTGDSAQGWSTSSAGTLVPSNVTTSTSDAVNFGTSSAGLATGTITLSGSASAGNLTFGSASGAITLSGSLRLASSGTIDVNNSAATITGIIAGAGTSLTKTGTGTLVLGSGAFTSQASNYAGATYVLGGTLQLLTGNNTYTLKAGNTVYLGDTTGSGNTTLQIGNQGAKSLFSGNIVVQSGNTGTSTIFVNPFNADTAGLPHLTGTITLGSANQAGHDVTIRAIAASQGITLSPVIQDASGATSFATVTFTGGGQTVLYFGNSTYQGATVISPNTPFSIGGAPSSLGTASPGSTTSGRLGSGPITNNGQLNFNRTDAYGGAYANAISGTGSLRLNTGTLTLSGSNTYTGTTTLSGSTGVRLNLASTNAIGTGTFTINGGSLDNTSAAALTIATNNPQNWNGDFTFVGTNPLNLGAGAVTLGATRQVTVTSSTLAVGGAIGGSTFGLTKAGAGMLALSGTNTFSGATTISAGILSINGTSALQGTSGVTIAGGAGLTYTGGAASLGKSITVTAGSGTGTIRNAGGLLTLSGNLSKDNSVLRLTGGAFNVTGTISGATAGTSDLLVDGTSSVTLSAANTYNGPTFVIESSTLAYGINNAIPSNSVVTLGNASSQGTLSMSTNTGAIGGLAFGSAGGTLQLAATSTSAAPLTASSGTMTLTNGTLDLAGSGTTAGLYRVLSAQSVAGAFANITGTSAAYQVITSATSVDYQQRAVLGAVSVTNPVVSIITGGSAAFTYTVANSALSGGASLGFTATGLPNVAGLSSGTATAGGSSGAISGLVFTGTSVGSSQTGAFTVTAPTAFGATTATGTVAVTVLDHALPGFLAAGIADPYTSGTLNINFGSIDESAGVQNFTYSLLNLASQTYGAGLTAGLDFTGVTADGDGFASGLTTFNNLVGGGTSSLFTFTFTPSGQGSFNKQFTLSFFDNQNLSGASARRDLTIVANVIVVPEPGAIALAGVGIALVCWTATRRRCRSAR